MTSAEPAGGAATATSEPGGGTSDGGQRRTDTDIRSVSVGELLGDVSRDLSTLMRQEVELAKAEVKAEVSKAAKGAGMLGAAGYAGHFIVIFLSLALWWGLAAGTGHIALSALIVAGIWVVIAATLAVLGRSTLRKVNPKPERTIETVGEIPPALKPNS